MTVITLASNNMDTELTLKYRSDPVHPDVHIVCTVKSVTDYISYSRMRCTLVEGEEWKIFRIVAKIIYRSCVSVLVFVFEECLLVIEQ